MTSDDDRVDRPMTVVERLCWALRPVTPSDRDEPFDVLNYEGGAVPSYEEQSEQARDEHPEVIDALFETLRDFDEVSDREKAHLLERVAREYADVNEEYATPENAGIRYK